MKRGRQVEIVSNIRTIIFGFNVRTKGLRPSICVRRFGQFTSTFPESLLIVEHESCSLSNNWSQIFVLKVCSKGEILTPTSIREMEVAKRMSLICSLPSSNTIKNKHFSPHFDLYGTNSGLKQRLRMNMF